MNRHSPSPQEPWESDPVWKLLDQSSTLQASARFTDDTVRLARLLPAPAPWWKAWLQPVPLSGLAAAAAVTLAFILNSQVSSSFSPEMTALDSPQAVEIQNIAETETLIAAADHLEDFSDSELVSLIGF